MTLMWWLFSYQSDSLLPIYIIISMIIKAIVLVTLLAAALAVEKAKVYEITSANLDKFLKDPSYWLIQVSCTQIILRRGQMSVVSEARGRVAIDRSCYLRGGKSGQDLSKAISQHKDHKKSYLYFYT